jgi:hypothetical protein
MPYSSYIVTLQINHDSRNKQKRIFFMTFKVDKSVKILNNQSNGCLEAYVEPLLGKVGEGRLGWVETTGTVVKEGSHDSAKQTGHISNTQKELDDIKQSPKERGRMLSVVLCALVRLVPSAVANFYNQPIISDEPPPSEVQLILISVEPYCLQGFSLELEAPAETIISTTNCLTSEVYEYHLGQPCWVIEPQPNLDLFIKELKCNSDAKHGANN